MIENCKIPGLMCLLNDPQMFVLPCVFLVVALLLVENIKSNVLQVFQIFWPIAPLADQLSFALEVHLETGYQYYTSSDVVCTFLAES